MIDLQQIKNSRVIVRVDYNIPVKNGQITDFTRIRKSIPTLQLLLQNQNKVTICSHLGRPDLTQPLDSEHNQKLSFQLLIDQISKEINLPIQFISNYPSSDLQIAIQNQPPNQVLLLENTRFHPEEEQNQDSFCQSLASHFDYFVFDAFGTAHRKHATTFGLAENLPSTLGLLVQDEVQGLDLGIKNPQKPLTIILGGAKIKTKIGVIKSFLNQADYICIGGALANTFLDAVGYELGQSLIEKEETNTAIQIINQAKKSNTELILPIDLITTSGQSKSAIDFTPNDNALDIGPLSISRIENIIKDSQTIIFNGPMGVYQNNLYSQGSEKILNSIAKNKQTTILGGGDTLDALTKFAIDPNKFTHVSTGGGAMLKYLEKGSLPVIEYITSQKS
jgi:phosphoglycerate kinase